MNLAVTVTSKAVDVIIWCALWFTIGVVAGSCAHSRTPYTEEMATAEFVADWAGDEAMSILRVVNPLGSSVRVTVACLSDSGNAERWDVDVAPHGSTSVLFQKLAKNWGVEMCHVETWARRR